MMQSLLSVRFWALEETFFETMKPLVLSRLQAGHDLSIFKREYQSALQASQTTRGTAVFSTNPRIAMVPLAGTMTKYGGMCSYGTTDLIKMIHQANADQDVDAIVMVIDTPGGTVVGTSEFSNAIARSAKPIVGFVDVMMASAGVWAGSQTDHLIINSEEREARVGSIGTLYMHINSSKYIESNIGEVRIIRAPQSMDKARLNSIEPLTDDLEAGIIAELKEITEDFISTVKAGRGSRLKAGEDIFTGNMYNAQEAKKRGLVDDIGTLDDAVQIAADLARTGAYKLTARINGAANSKVNNQVQNKNQMSLKDWFGGKSTSVEEASAENTEESAAELTVQATELSELSADMQASMAENETLLAENTQLKAEKADVQASLSVAQQTIAEHQATIDSQQTKIHELEKAPVSKSSKAVKAGDDVSVDNDDRSKTVGSVQAKAERIRMAKANRFAGQS